MQMTYYFCGLIENDEVRIDAVRISAVPQVARGTWIQMDQWHEWITIEISRLFIGEWDGLKCLDMVVLLQSAKSHFTTW